MIDQSHVQASLSDGEQLSSLANRLNDTVPPVIATNTNTSDQAIAPQRELAAEGAGRGEGQVTLAQSLSLSHSRSLGRSLSP